MSLCLWDSREGYRRWKGKRLSVHDSVAFSVWPWRPLKTPVPPARPEPRRGSHVRKCSSEHGPMGLSASSLVQVPLLRLSRRSSVSIPRDPSRRRTPRCTRPKGRDGISDTLDLDSHGRWPFRKAGYALRWGAEKPCTQEERTQESGRPGGRPALEGVMVLKPTRKQSPLCV